MFRNSRRSNWFSRPHRSSNVAANTPRSKREGGGTAAIETQEFVVDPVLEEKPQPAVQVNVRDTSAQNQMDVNAEPFELHPFDSKLDPQQDPTAQRLPVFQRISNKAKGQIKHQIHQSKRSAKQGLQAAQQYTKQQAKQVQANLLQKFQENTWTFISGAILMMAGGTALGAVMWLWRTPPMPECNKINVISSDSERLFCAQQTSQSGKAEDILAGIALVKSWSKDHPMFPQAERALAQWSDALLVVAREKLASNDLDGAIKLAQQIPDISPNFQQAQEEISFWQVERNRGQKLFEQIQTALKKQFWNDASALIAKLTLVDDPLWQNRLGDIRQQLENEKKAGVYLKQALEFVKTNPADKWGQAIGLLMPIDRRTFVWQTAEKEINQWRDRLFKMAAEKLFKKDVTGATGLLDSLPKQVEITEVQRDLVRLVQVTEVDGQKQDKSPMLNQLWGLMLANNSAQQVQSNSPYHKNVQAILPRLNNQVENVVQLEIARGLASLGQISALQLAVNQAEQIAAKEPRRLQAQTLLAEWRKGIQVLEDRPVIKQAELLAKAGGIDRLRSAVALIDRIPKNRSTFGLAQQQKGEWVAQIQTIEDKPILNEARSIAQSGQLGKAIQVASRIRPGRALYGDAQQDVGGWAAELRAIEERAILARAQDLAAQGSLTRAIDLASQIGTNAVASEAQQSINQWTQERAEIRRSRSEDAPVAPPPDPIDQPADVVEPDPAPAYVPPEPAPLPVDSAPLPPDNSVEVPTESVDPAPPAEPAPPP
jgi:tetratricopeptide (TPR) repeat protein